MAKANRPRAKKYEEKVFINGTFDELVKALITPTSLPAKPLARIIDIQTDNSFGASAIFKYNTKEIKEKELERKRELSLTNSQDEQFFRNKYSFGFAPHNISQLGIEYEIPEYELGENHLPFRVEVRAHISGSATIVNLNIGRASIRKERMGYILLKSKEEFVCDRLTVYFSFPKVENEINATIKLVVRG